MVQTQRGRVFALALKGCSFCFHRIFEKKTFQVTSSKSRKQNEGKKTFHVYYTASLAPAAADVKAEKTAAT